MSMITEIGLVSRPKMDEFRTKYGGVAFDAMEEISQLDLGGTWEITKYMPGIRWRRPGWESVDSDRRFAERGLHALQLAHSRASKNPGDPTTTALSDALFVYKQVVPGYADFDDSGTTVERPPGIVNVLSPEHCKEVLEYWASIDLPKLEQGIQEYPNLFEEVGPAYVFKDARQLIEYMRVYMRYLGQAAAEDRYFVSFFA